MKYLPKYLLAASTELKRQPVSRLISTDYGYLGENDGPEIAERVTDFRKINSWVKVQ